MDPQLGIGGCAPIPKKLKPLSIRIALAKLAAEITITGAKLLGSMWCQSVLKCEYPKVFAAVMYCCSFMLIYILEISLCPRLK